MIYARCDRCSKEQHPEELHQIEGIGKRLWHLCSSCHNSYYEMIKSWEEEDLRRHPYILTDGSASLMCLDLTKAEAVEKTRKAQAETGGVWYWGAL